MVRENRRSLLAAVALSVLTLATFAASAGRGPESAVKKFHEAIKENDEAAMAVSMAGPVDGVDQRQLIGLVRQLLSIEPHVELGKVQSAGRDAVVDVSYSLRNGRRQVVRFTLLQSQSRWQVDAKKTLDLYRRPFGF